MFRSLYIAGVVLAVIAHAHEHLDGIAVCEVKPDSGSPRARIQGTIIFEQAPEDVIEVHIELEGFNSTDSNMRHGFHIHEKGDLGDGCKDAGGHYNPYNKNHGAPEDEDRHVGDLGNIREMGDGTVDMVIRDDSGLIEFSGEHSVIGRAVVIHETYDDLGRGGYPDSRTTGHAGGRLACCIIKEVNVSMATRVHHMSALCLVSLAFVVKLLL